jgi:hypothetical protein
MKAASEACSWWALVEGGLCWVIAGAVVAVDPVVDVRVVTELDPVEEKKWPTTIPPSPRASTAATAQ